MWLSPSPSYSGEWLQKQLSGRLPFLISFSFPQTDGFSAFDQCRYLPLWIVSFRCYLNLQTWSRAFSRTLQRGPITACRKRGAPSASSLNCGGSSCQISIRKAVEHYINCRRTQQKVCRIRSNHNSILSQPSQEIDQNVYILHISWPTGHHHGCRHWRETNPVPLRLGESSCRYPCPGCSNELWSQTTGCPGNQCQYLFPRGDNSNQSWKHHSDPA